MDSHAPATVTARMTNSAPGMSEERGADVLDPRCHTRRPRGFRPAARTPSAGNSPEPGRSSAASPVASPRCAARRTISTAPSCRARRGRAPRTGSCRWPRRSWRSAPPPARCAARMSRPSATRRPCCSRSSAGPISGAITANGAMVISRYSATLLLLSAEAAAKNNVLANATAIAASTAKLATTGQVRAVRPDLSAPSAVAARWTRPYILEPISRLRCAAARVTVTRCAAARRCRHSSACARSSRRDCGPRPGAAGSDSRSAVPDCGVAAVSSLG